MDHRVRQTVDNLATVGPVASARGAIGAEKHFTIVATSATERSQGTGQVTVSADRALDFSV
jgi:hypothetical protein